MVGVAPHFEVLSFRMMLFSCSNFLFGLLDMCFIRQRSVQCDANIHREVAVPTDAELFATFTIPHVEEAGLRLCRICAELVCGIVLQQTVYNQQIASCASL